jgi:predicted nucleic acid-binding protein
MTTYFADTFYFLALLNRDDAAHRRAAAIAAQLPGPLVTTAWVLTEVADAMAAPANRPAFLNLLAILRSNPAVEIVPADAALFDQGVDLYSRRPDKEWSLTDCISFNVMTQHGLTEALTADHHFEQAGFRAVLAAE